MPPCLLSCRGRHRRNTQVSDISSIRSSSLFEFYIFQVGHGHNKHISSIQNQSNYISDQFW